MAERAGFEPANLCGLHAFQACALSQTTRPLQYQATGLYQNLFKQKPVMTLSPHRFDKRKLVIRCALIDPISDQLDLIRG